eukprot:GHVR01130009.1.p1 GENE.GHVR01130009.1~~GHVR01130009.1.p1  ORF type:complete len:123 (+),score=3.94 GHVR01130009.1:18-386(+)
MILSLSARSAALTTFLALTSAPFSIKCLITLTLSLCLLAARIRAVKPSLFFLLTSAPLSVNHFTTSIWPLSEAHIRGHINYIHTQMYLCTNTCRVYTTAIHYAYTHRGISTSTDLTLGELFL